MTGTDAPFDPAQSTPLVEPVKRASIIVRDVPAHTALQATLAVLDGGWQRDRKVQIREREQQVIQYI